MSYLKSIKFPKKNINLCWSYSSECVREVYSKTARLPISRKPDIGFLRELNTFKSMVWRRCKLNIRFLKSREQILKFVQSCFIWPWIHWYNCASELCLSLGPGVHFNKSLINILQLVWLFYDDPEWSYDHLKLTFIFSKMGVTQVLTYPWSLVTGYKFGSINNEYV